MGKQNKNKQHSINMKVQSIFALSALSSTLAMAKYRLIDLNVNKDYYEYIQDLPSRNTNDDEIPNEGQINTCFNNYCTQTGEYCGEWVGATVRRLPVWGAEVAEKYIDFEWPTQEEFDQMSPEAKIQSLEFKSTSSKEVESWLGSVKVNLTNGESSPIFENSKHDPTLWERQETIEFDQNVSIRSVDSTFLYEYIYALQFYDGNEELAQEYVASAIPDYEEYVYDPSSRYELAENEELIGVYGVKDYYENFITFGFKVKVK